MATVVVRLVALLLVALIAGAVSPSKAVSVPLMGTTYDAVDHTYGTPHISVVTHIGSQADRVSKGAADAQAGLPLAVSAGGVAAKGGVGPVRVGQAGEAAVRSSFDIGPKATAEIGGRTRILDGLTDSTVSEVKNVARQSYT